ncbi:hypothetical protein ACSSS7_007841 [Eimeria intestinalis]
MAAVVTEVVRVQSAAAEDSRGDDAGLGVGYGDADQRGVARAGAGAPDIQDPAVARGGLRSGPPAAGRGCGVPLDELLDGARGKGHSRWLRAFILGVCEVDRDVRVIVSGGEGGGARVGVRCEAEMLEAVAEQTGVLVFRHCRLRSGRVRLGNSWSSSGGSPVSSGRGAREVVNVFLLGARAILHLKSKLRDPQRPAHKATTLRAVIALVLEGRMVRANAELERVDVVSGSLEGPDDGRCFEFGGRRFFLVVAQGARGVGDDSLALFVRQQVGHAEAVARAVAVQIGGPLVAWNGLDFRRAWLEATSGDDMAQVADRFGTETAPRWVQVEVGRAQGGEELAEVGAVIGPGVAVHDNVVDIAHCGDPFHAA